MGLHRCNAATKNPLRPGDVILSIGGTKTKNEMVQMLKDETSMTLEIIRHTKFEAEIEKTSPQEPLCMDVSELNGQLVIQQISPRMSAVTRYNAKHFTKPLVESDLICAVNGKTQLEEMVKLIKQSLKFTLTITRGQL